jgi:hypothetical protein
MLAHRLRRAAGASHFIDTTDLVAYWRMDGDGTDLLGGFNGTVSTVTWTTGFHGQCGSFNGSNSEFSFSAPTVIGTGDFSVSAWVQTNTTSGARVVITTTNASSGMRFSTSGTHIQVSENSVANYSIGGTITTGVWYHIVWVKSGTGTNNIVGYIDGTFVGDASIGTTSTGSGTGYIGRAGNSLERWNGLIDEVSLWKRALSAGEVADLYNSGAGLFL